MEITIIDIIIPNTTSLFLKKQLCLNSSLIIFANLGDKHCFSTFSLFPKNQKVFEKSSMLDLMNIAHFLIRIPNFSLSLKSHNIFYLERQGILKLMGGKKE